MLGFQSINIDLVLRVGVAWQSADGFVAENESGRSPRLRKETKPYEDGGNWCLSMRTARED